MANTKMRAADKVAKVLGRAVQEEKTAPVISEEEGFSKTLVNDYFKKGRDAKDLERGVIDQNFYDHIRDLYYNNYKENFANYINSSAHTKNDKTIKKGTGSSSDQNVARTEARQNSEDPESYNPYNDESIDPGQSYAEPIRDESEKIVINANPNDPESGVEVGKITGYRYHVVLKDEEDLIGELSRSEMEMMCRLYCGDGGNLTQRRVSAEFPSLTFKNFKRILRVFGITKDDMPLAKHQMEEKSQEEIVELIYKNKANAVSKRIEQGKIKDLEKEYEKALKGLEEQKQKFKDIENVVQEIGFDQSDIDPIRIEQHPLDREEALVVYLSDMHIGAETGYDSIYDNRYDKSVVYERLKTLLKKLYEAYCRFGRFDKIIVVNLGDSVDGYNNKTTRGGHDLDQNMGNKEQFNTYMETMKWFFDSLVHMNAANGIEYHCATDDNHCLSEDTEILTEDGWKKYDEITYKDKISTVNPETGGCEYYYPMDININEEKETTMHHYSNKNIDALVTSKHKMLYRNYVYSHKENNKEKYKKGDYKFSYSENMPSRQQVYFKTSVINHSNDLEDVSDDVLKIAGWILTDGTVKYYKNKPVGYEIYQTEDKLHLITNILDSANIGYRLSPKDNAYTKNIQNISIKSKKKLYTIGLNKKHTQKEFLDSLLIFLKDKEMSNLYNLSKRQFDIVLNNIIKGDGTRKKGNNTSATIYGKKGFLDKVQALCIYNSHKANIENYRNEDFRLNVVFDVTDFSFKPHKSFHKVHYKGKTWCVTVPNNTIITRRNGKVSVQGNSGDFGYTINKALELYLNCKYPDIYTHIFEQFIETFKYGRHTFICLHGKDKEDMKFPMKLELCDKVENYFLEYMHNYGIDINDFVTVAAGDLHQTISQKGKFFRWRRILSFYGASKYIHTNFGRTTPGAEYEIVSKYEKDIFENKVHF